MLEFDPSSKMLLKKLSLWLKKYMLVLALKPYPKLKNIFSNCDH